MFHTSSDYSEINRANYRLIEIEGYAIDATSNSLSRYPSISLEINMMHQLAYYVCDSANYAAITNIR